MIGRNNKYSIEKVTVIEIEDDPDRHGETFMIDFGKAICEKLYLIEMTLKEFGNSMGASEQFMEDIISGKNRHIDDICWVAHELGICISVG